MNHIEKATEKGIGRGADFPIESVIGKTVGVVYDILLRDQGLSSIWLQFNLCVLTVDVVCDGEMQTQGIQILLAPKLHEIRIDIEVQTWQVMQITQLSSELLQKEMCKGQLQKNAIVHRLPYEQPLSIVGCDSR